MITNKSLSFIGKTFNDGKLKVVGIHGKQGSITTFKVTCEVCSQDKELFPEGYFITTKGNLEKGQLSCGCSKKHNWKEWQYLILARRAGEGRFIVHGFAEKFHGVKTKLNCTCLIDNCKWTPSINNILNNKYGCPLCVGKYRPTEQEALDKCKQICEDSNYEFLGFTDGYKNALTTRFKYLCPMHGVQEVSYNNFVNVGNRCLLCTATLRALPKRTPETIALSRCENICEEMDYTSLGFPDRYKNSCSKFEYKCPKHGIQQVKYTSFIHGHTRCPYCAKESRGLNGYYPERKDEKDFLYIMNFDDQYVKVGRSFDIDDRIGNLKSESKIKNIIKLRIYTATHKQIYDLEQELHEELRERGFQYYVNWSTECFQNDSLFVLNKLLDSCGFERII